MRYAILAAGLLAAAVSAGSAAAQGSDGNFCAQMMKGETGKPLNCSYATMTQCEAAVKNDQGICIENPKTKM